QIVRVTMADGSQLTGRVRTVAPTVQSGTRTGLVYVDLPKPDGARPGMLASVVVRDGYSYVFVVTGDQRVERRRVETGGVREGRVEIVTGLNAAERVV